jgi:hypothetical protein
VPTKAAVKLQYAISHRFVVMFSLTGQWPNLESKVEVNCGKKPTEFVYALRPWSSARVCETTRVRVLQCLYLLDHQLGDSHLPPPPLLLSEQIVHICQDRLSYGKRSEAADQTFAIVTPVCRILRLHQPWAPSTDYEARSYSTDVSDLLLDVSSRCPRP